MRKLASIQEINNLSSIPGADLIEVATVLGWHCVVKKGDFKIGDWCIYFEIDSVLPELSQFEFLREKCWNSRYKGYRIKTLKLKGQISQGLVMPVSICNKQISDLYIGYDLTEEMNVQKYLPKISANLNSKNSKSFPTNLVPKTDEVRIQSVPNLLIRQNGEEVFVTEKLDGTSATYYIHNDHFGVCSRNLEVSDDSNNVYWAIAKKYNIETKLRSWTKNTLIELAIQGEIIGPGIQKNKYNLSNKEIRFFNIFDITNHKHINFDMFKDIIEYMSLETVPILEEKASIINDSDFWVKKSIGKSILNKNTKREGIVIRTTTNKTDPDVGRLSFKAINPEFLLKHKE